MSIADIAKKGRYGDNHLLHVSDAEVQGLNALANKHFGHGLTTNPDTGLPEAFLFAPLLAGTLAASVPTLAGMGALGTGLAAAGLGTAEAAARGYDDPLAAGMMSGLTAGAGASIGDYLGGVGEAGAMPPGADAVAQGGADAVAQGTGQAGVDTFTQYGMSPAEMAKVYQAPTPGADTFTQFGMSPSQYSEVFGTTSSVPYTPSSAAPAPSYSMSDKLAGAKVVGQSGENIGQFISDNSGALGVGTVGLGGVAGMEEAQALREQGEQSEAARKAEADAKRKAIQDQITANYAAVGRPMPTGPYGGPLFAEGGRISAEEVVGSKYGQERRKAAEESMMNRAGYGILDLLGIKDPTTLRRAQQRYRDENDMSPARGGTPYAAGGQVGNFNKARGFAAGGQAYTTNIYGDKIPYDNSITPKNASGKGGVFGALLNNMFTQLSSQLPQDESANPQGARHQALVDNLQTGMGNKLAVEKLEKEGYFNGGYLETGGRVGDGMSDDIPATIDGTQPAALSDGEFVIPADVVSHLGNGSSDAGAQQLYDMMDRIRQARTGTKEQGKEINAKKMLPS